MNDGGNFLHQKIKESGNTLEWFAQTCGVSKSTLYRVLRGTQKLTPPLASRISDVLQLTHYERERLYRGYSLPFDTPPLSAFDMDRMYRLVMSWFKDEDDSNPAPTEEEVVFFDDISSVKTVHSPESFARHIAGTLSPQCKNISIYINNCCHDLPMLGAFRFLHELLMAAENVSMSIDHILNFQKGQLEDQICFIRKFYPLFQSSGCRYQFYYHSNYGEQSAWFPTLMENAIVFSYQAVYPDGKTYPRYILILPDNITFSEGFSSRESFFHQHLVNKFLQIRKNCESGIQASVSITGFYFQPHPSGCLCELLCSAEGQCSAVGSILPPAGNQARGPHGRAAHCFAFEPVSADFRCAPQPPVHHHSYRGWPRRICRDRAGF